MTEKDAIVVVGQSGLKLFSCHLPACINVLAAMIKAVVQSRSYCYVFISRMSHHHTGPLISQLHTCTPTLVLDIDLSWNLFKCLHVQVEICISL